MPDNNRHNSQLSCGSDKTEIEIYCHNHNYFLENSQQESSELRSTPSVFQSENTIQITIKAALSLWNMTVTQNSRPLVVTEKKGKILERQLKSSDLKITKLLGENLQFIEDI